MLRRDWRVRAILDTRNPASLAPKLTCRLVIVRRVVAARKLHDDQQNAKSKPAFMGKGQPQAKSSMTTATDKEMDVSDFAERPGVKKVNRGGLWARVRSWFPCC